MNERRASESAPTAAEPPSPDGLATPSSPSVTNEPNLPPIAADADDLKAIKKAVDDAAFVGGGLWLSYLFVLFYFAVAAGAVTNEDLFPENPVKLPFLGIDLPLAGSGPHWRMALIDVAVTPIRSRSMISAHRSHRP
jgi:hypothetical protein